MNLRVLAVGMPHANSNILFSALDALGLSAAPMAHHELFTTAQAFFQNSAIDNKLDETSEAYKVLNEVEPNQFLPGFFFYSKAGARLLNQLAFKKIIIVRDFRDMLVGQVVENMQPDSYLSNYYQKLPDNARRVSASIKGFTEAQSGFPGVLLESVYIRLRYFLSWATEPDTLVLRYEDLVDETKPGNAVVKLTGLRQLSDWLGLVRTSAQLWESSRRVAAYIRQQPALVRTGMWREYFTPQLIPAVRSAVGRLLHKYRYETDPQWIPPEINHRVIAISQPKAGTHLLDKALNALGLQVTQSTTTEFLQSLHGGYLVDGIFEAVQPGEYFLTHLYHSWNAKRVLNGLKFKKILIVRDPHDVVVSYYRYVCSIQHNFSAHFLSLADADTGIMDIIRGAHYIGLANIHVSYTGVLDWLKEPDCLLVRFEDLVGTAGKGSRDKQLQTLQLICQHLELDLGVLSIVGYDVKTVS